MKKPQWPINDRDSAAIIEEAHDLYDEGGRIEVGDEISVPDGRDEAEGVYVSAWVFVPFDTE